jgi:4-hydroxy-3-methylbut-2-enyl diphosphate reductase
MRMSVEEREPLPLNIPQPPRKSITIARAEYLGMCFGVRDAIALAREKAKDGGLTILGELVHNEAVLSDLRSAGVHVESDFAKVNTKRAMITAHGASEKRLDAARAQGFELFEATCPLVHHAHRAVQQLVAEGYHPVIVGKRDHVEVRGLTEDLAEFDLILSPEDVDGLAFRPKFGVAAQTTQPIAKVRALVQRLREKFPSSEVKFMDTVCQPTKQRQRAAEELAANSDVVVVIGGANSNNTKELVHTCSRFCAKVHHVQGPADLRGDWFAGAERIGLTAGTSTPDYMIEEVENRIQEII